MCTFSIITFHIVFTFKSTFTGISSMVENASNMLSFNIFFEIFTSSSDMYPQGFFYHYML